MNLIRLNININLYSNLFFLIAMMYPRFFFSKDCKIFTIFTILFIQNHKIKNKLSNINLINN